MILFVAAAIIIVLMISIVVDVSVITILIRLLISSFIFAVVGLVIGQLIDYNLNQVRPSFDTKKEVLSKENKIEAKDVSSEITPLEFERVDNDKRKVINNNPDTIAKVIRGLE